MSARAADKRPRGIVGRIYGNLGLLLGGKAAAGLFSLVYLVIAARTLGPLDYGILVLVNGYAVTVGGIVTFPGWHAIVRFGADAMNKGETARLWRLMRFAGMLELGAGALAIAIAALLAPVIGPRLGLTAAAQSYVVPYSLAVLATVRATPAGYLQLLRRFDLLGFHNIINPSIRLAGTVIVALAGWGLKGFLVVWLLAALSECLSLWIIGWLCARRALAQGEAPGQALSGGSARADNPGLLRFMLLANADATFSELSPRIALLAVGWVLGPAAAGLFSIAQRATVLIAQPAQILGQAAYAELAHLVAGGGRGAALRQALVRCVGIAMLSSVPVLIGLAFFSRQLVIFLGGIAFAAAAPVAIGLMIARAIMLVGPPVSAALIAMGRPEKSVTANVLASVLSLPLLPVAMHHFGLIGSAWFAIGEALAASALLVGFVWRESGARAYALSQTVA